MPNGMSGILTNHRVLACVAAAGLALAWTGCSGGSSADGGPPDAGRAGAPLDAGPHGPMFDADGGLIGSTPTDAGPVDAGPMAFACSGAVSSFCDGAHCASTWSQVVAGPCGGCLAGEAAAPCGDYLVVSCGHADTSEVGYFQADGGALVAVISGGPGGVFASCNTPSNTFLVPSCQGTEPALMCDGGS